MFNNGHARYGGTVDSAPRHHVPLPSKVEIAASVALNGCLYLADSVEKVAAESL